MAKDDRLGMHDRRTRGFRRRLAVTGIAGSILATGAAMGGFGASQAGAAKPPIQVGAIINLTGPIASYGSVQRGGLETYIHYANAHGGVGGRQIKLDVLDEAASLTNSLTDVHTLVNDHAEVILGPFSSANVVAVAPVAAAAKTPLIGLSDSKAVVSAPYFIGGSATYTDSGSSLVQFATHQLATKLGKKFTSFGILSGNSSSGVDFVNAATAAIKGDHLKVTSALEPDLATDISPEINTILAAHPQVVLEAGSDSQLVSTVPLLRQGGFKGPILSNYAGSSDTDLETLKDSNVYVQRVWLTPGAPGAATMRQQAAAAGQTKTMAGNSYFTQAYLDGKVIVTALKKCGSSCTPASLYKVLSNITVPSGGLSGAISTTPNSRSLFKQFQMYDYDPNQGVVTSLGTWVNS